MNKKQRNTLIASGAVLLALFLIWFFRDKSVAFEESAPEDSSNAGQGYYATYNMPPISRGENTGGGSGNIDFGDTVIGNTNLDDLANKICGCMNKCQSPAPILFVGDLDIPDLPPYIDNYIEPPPPPTVVIPTIDFPPENPPPAAQPYERYSAWQLKYGFPNGYETPDEYYQDFNNAYGYI